MGEKIIFFWGGVGKEAKREVYGDALLTEPFNLFQENNNVSQSETIHSLWVTTRYNKTRDDLNIVFEFQEIEKNDSMSFELSKM